MGPFQSKAAKATTPEAQYEMLGSLAKAVDGVRDEIKENTAAVDGLCRMVRAIAQHVGAPLAE